VRCEGSDRASGRIEYDNFLHSFHPAVSNWFSASLGTPTAAQQRGWAAIRARQHTLIAAPTGSGKTLAAFLTALDDLFREGLVGPLPDEVRVIYVSPLKALSADIHKNLAEPRRGIRQAAEALGLEPPRLTVAVRTGDTPTTERAAMLRTPPHILVTTPESLYLLLTASRSRDMLRTARTVIVDEIHAVIGTRRGAHLALTLERLQHVAAAPLQRIGLSATQRPIEEVARYLVGTEGGAASIVDEGHRRTMDLALEVPNSPLDAVMSHEVWSEYYDRLTSLIEQHKTTLVFVNTRRMAERIARQLSDRLGDEAVTAHHGSLSKEKRLDAEVRLKSGALKALVATASLELGIDIGHVDLVCQIGSPHRIATFLQRAGRSGHTVWGVPKGRLFPASRDDLIECAALLRSVRHGQLDAIVSHDAPLDVLAQQVVAEAACEEYAEDDLMALARRAWPYRSLAKDEFEGVVRMASEGFATKRGRRGALLHRDEVNARLRGRRGARSLAITSGGAIPEVADYRVVLDPDDTFIGTLNEDFAIESTAGDVIQLGNASWQITQVGPGVVRVVDARGAPPTLPFWLGEAPARSDELSYAVSDLRRAVEPHLGTPAAHDWFAVECGVAPEAADQAIAYLQEGRAALGVLPTQQTLVLERFFDESGGMQLVLHAPFGSRVNKAWGLALRKRFCRQFNFELQAAATEDGLLLSLGPQHSFPLADVFRYLHPATARDVLVQAFLDAPVFQTRWRWNTTISLAVPRNRHGKKVAPQLQRMLADDLMAAVFPDAAACLENIPGDRQIPDHPLVTQAVRDCLQEAMDFEALSGILERLHRGEIQCVARDTTEPSALCHELLNARPYAFLDDAPLEERRAHAVYTRRVGEPGSSDLAALDPAAIARVVDEARPDARDADELHDVLLTAGFLTASEAVTAGATIIRELVDARRATLATVSESRIYVAAERLPELLAIRREATFEPQIAAPRRRAERQWAADEALVELLRGRVAFVGPISAAELAAPLGVDAALVHQALETLESQGLVLRGTFRSQARGLEWCERGLLARIHRYTLNRLRAEIEPVSPADYMRFLFDWQHAGHVSRLSGTDGLLQVLKTLDGFEVPAGAWEASVLPLRMDRYDPQWLDLLCLTGQVGWARLSSAAQTRVVRTTSIALFLREHAHTWSELAAADRRPDHEALASVEAQTVHATLGARGALFVHELASSCGLSPGAVRQALGELVSAGVAASDGFAGLRALIADKDSGPRDGQMAGRWSAFIATGAPPAAPDRGPEGQAPARATAGRGAQRSGPGDEAIETHARVLLRRYGVVCRRVLARESIAQPWRVLARVYRMLEARGEIRGGRFVSGLAGEQFALPEAVQRLREIRRTPHDDRLTVISAADPLNLAGLVTAGDRVSAIASTRIAYRNGVPLAAMEGDYIRPLTTIDPAIAADVASALAGRRVPPVISGFVGRVS
jgi:ATP-dependent helicase Lhr and Lhr-like helicase